MGVLRTYLMMYITEAYKIRGMAAEPMKLWEYSFLHIVTKQHWPLES